MVSWTRDGIQRLIQVSLYGDEQLLLALFAFNDEGGRRRGKRWPPRMDIPLAEFKENLETLLTEAHQTLLKGVIPTISIIAGSIIALAVVRNGYFSNSRSPSQLKAHETSEFLTKPSSPELLNDKAEVSKIAFTRGDWIYLYDVKSRKTKRLTQGYDPDASRNGKFIAYSFSESDLGGDSSIKLYDIQSGAIRDFKSLRGFPTGQARWSHDSSKLAFNIIINKRPRVGVLDMETGLWEDVTKGLVFNDKRGGVDFDSWSAENDSILCHDQYTIYEISLDGNVQNTISIEGIVPREEVFGGNHFQLSHDRKWVLFSGARSPENTAIYLLNLADKKVRKLTPPTLDGSEPSWLPSNDEIMFSRGRTESKDRVSDLCKLSISTGEISIIIENAAEGSYSTQ
jgi:Tol biopolymer transport system component